VEKLREKNALFERRRIKTLRGATVILVVKGALGKGKM